MRAQTPKEERPQKIILDERELFRAEQQNALANLSYIAGGMEVVPMEETLHVPVFDVTPGIQKALEARPDVRAARLAVERARVVEKLKGKGMAPTLDFGAQWTAWV